jgi:hypothetical protein
VLIGQANRDIVHHLLTYECDPRMVYDDNNLPDGICDDMGPLISPCAVNIATGWAVGGDDVSFQSLTIPSLMSYSLYRL